MCQAWEEIKEDCRMEGHAAGKAEGQAEGRMDERKVIALKLLKEPAFTLTKIAELTGLSEQEVEDLKLTIA